MGGLRRTLVGLWIAGLAAGAPFAAITLDSRHTGDRALTAALGLLVGWAFVGTGLFAWWRRPANRSGALMAGIGFAWFAAGLSAANASLPYTIGIAVDGVFAAMLAHLLLGFPDGRLAESAARAVQAAIYATVTVLQVPALLFQPGEPGGPDNLMMVRSDPGLSDALDAGQLAVAIALVVAALILLARRWAGRGPARRRALGPVLVTAAVTIVLFLAAKVAEDVVAAPHGALDALTLLAFAAVPFAFLAGLLRARLAGADAVRALVARVGQAPDPEALRGALAAALRDPTVALAYWLPESGRFADAGGRPVAVPGGGRRPGLDRRRARRPARGRHRARRRSHRGRPRPRAGGGRSGRAGAGEPAPAGGAAGADRGAARLPHAAGGGGRPRAPAPGARPARRRTAAPGLAPAHPQARSPRAAGWRRRGRPAAGPRGGRPRRVAGRAAAPRAGHPAAGARRPRPGGRARRPGRPGRRPRRSGPRAGPAAARAGRDRRLLRRRGGADQCHEVRARDPRDRDG
jgi:hypothetical protein